MTTLPDSPLSLWLDTYGPYEPLPALSCDRRVDVAIIGGGFTGLVTAYEIKRAEPGTEVAVLEAKTVGYGASGRNGSFGMTVVGLGFGTTAMLRGKRFLKAAHTYMEQAVDRMEALVRDEALPCDMIRPGFLRVATTGKYVKRLQHDLELMGSLGFEGFTWLDQAATRERVDSARYLGGLLEDRLVLVNPARLVRAERDLAVRAGAAVYENTPVLSVRSDGGFELETPGGTVQAEKVLFATNAYSHLVAGRDAPGGVKKLKRKQTPAFTYMMATAPLTDAQLGPIGWHGREGLEDARNLIHYYRITPDRRLVMGGGPVGLTYGGTLDADRDEKAWAHLLEHVHFLFPSLSDVEVTHRWGGPFSVTADLAPAMGFLGDTNAVYSVGCIGHGVSTSHLNARVLRDLLLKGESTIECPFVNRFVVPWPGEPARFAAVKTIRAALQAEDWFHERSLR